MRLSRAAREADPENGGRDGESHAPDVSGGGAGYALLEVSRPGMKSRSARAAATIAPFERTARGTAGLSLRNTASQGSGVQVVARQPHQPNTADLLSTRA